MSSNSAKSNVGARLASPDKVSVVLTGHQGRVGEVLAAALKTAPEIDYLGGIGVEDDLPHLLRQWGPQVVVDFTRPATARSIAMAAVASGAAPVVGTSGMSESTVDELESACQQAGIGGIVAPNFAIGAVAMMWLAERVASLFTSAEVIEMHHTGKADAPSGTALATARRLSQAGNFHVPPPDQISLAGTRGGEVGGVAVHSVRMPGVVAEQEVILGLTGQTLSIAHRTISREAFIP